jgi:hypothetical protein
MPWYRINGAPVHMKGTKMPAPCAAVVEIEGKFTRCAAPSAYQCDWPAGGGSTCDLSICGLHRTPVGPNKDYCPMHAADAAHQAGPGLFTGLL